MPDYIVHKAVDLSNLSAKVTATLDATPYVISPKYDGCHAVFLFDAGKVVNVLSRTGEIVKSMNHVAEDLRQTYDLSVGRIAICGEAWIPDTEFSAISGLFRRHSPVPDLQFVPFDCIPWDYNETTEGPEVYLGQCDGVLYGAPYSARIKSLQNRKSIVTSVRCPLFLTVEAGKLIAMATTQALHYKALGGYDGVVAAKLSGRYVVGAGKGGEFIKFKPLMSESLRVVAVEPAIGIKTGKNTCALVVVYKDQPQRVSTGLTQAEVNEYVNFPASIIGKTVEVEAMGVTVTGLLREPRYKGIRNDVI